ncbi:MAG TPA: hypothetical protein VN634_05935 [Candidatus Limnocylindrales bacterium]|nr:hypothetical protein [Candidatus Limnocylindrales bacterium]
MQSASLRHPRLRLVALCFLMLFVELALIRWSGSNIVYLSYFSNFVLLGSFLGIGVGFLRSDAKTDRFQLAPIGLGLFVLYVYLSPVTIDRTGESLIFFGELRPSGFPIWATLPIVFLAVAIVMAMIGEGVARQFARFDPLDAYRLDITGSIIGIVVFSSLSFAWAPPVVWGVVAAALLLWLVDLDFRSPRTLVSVAALGVMILALGAESMQPGYFWSPYYKVRVDGDRVSVNGIPHQHMGTPEQRRRDEEFYFLPYSYRAAKGPPKNVLIVGAGTGSDVAIALAEGVEHIDAVEIDPRLQQLGVALHPSHPYDDSRVDVHIDDGRAFLQRSDKLYDVILFALPDSLTLVAGQSSLRLESYLFTLESMQTARAHLAPGGEFAMYNFYREPWLVDRLAGTLEAVYGHAPCIFERGSDEGGLAVMAASPDAATLSCPERWKAAGEAVPPPATDNHPFLYLRSDSIPGFYLVTISLILLCSALMIKVVGGSYRSMTSYGDLFFMGAAFLLLETKNVVQFALLFGTTWFVNAVVFGGILLTVLAAIEVTRRVRFEKPERLYLVLLAALAVAWAVPGSWVLDLALPARFAVATALAFAPVFVANLVFAQRFRDVADPTASFGANLLGAMFGGVLEYMSLIVGYRSLLIVTALLYGCAFLLGRSHFAVVRQPART